MIILYLAKKDNFFLFKLYQYFKEKIHWKFQINALLIPLKYDKKKSYFYLIVTGIIVLGGSSQIYDQALIKLSLLPQITDTK